MWLLRRVVFCCFLLLYVQEVDDRNTFATVQSADYDLESKIVDQKANYSEPNRSPVCSKERDLFGLLKGSSKNYHCMYVIM